jgi:hypothetical protein
MRETEKLPSMCFSKKKKNKKKKKKKKKNALCRPKARSERRFVEIRLKILTDGVENWHNQSYSCQKLNLKVSSLHLQRGRLY